MDHLRCSFLLIHHPREPFLRQEWIVVWSLFRRENGKLGISLRVPPPGNTALLRLFKHSFSLNNPLIRPCFQQNGWHCRMIQGHRLALLAFSYARWVDVWRVQVEGNQSSKKKEESILLMVQKSSDHQLQVGSLSHYLQDSSTIPGGDRGFCPSTFHKSESSYQLWKTYSVWRLLCEKHQLCKAPRHALRNVHDTCYQQACWTPRKWSFGRWGNSVSIRQKMVILQLEVSATNITRTYPHISTKRRRFANINIKKLPTKPFEQLEILIQTSLPSRKLTYPTFGISENPLPNHLGVWYMLVSSRQLPTSACCGSPTEAQAPMTAV